MAFTLLFKLLLACIFAENILNSTDVFDNGISPEPRINPSLAVDFLGKFLFLFGGRSKAGFLNDLWTFDLEKSFWSLIYAQSNSPGKKYLEPRSNSKSFFRGKTREFCIYSGSSDEYIFSDFWCFSTSLYIWNKINFPIIEFLPLPKVKYLEFNDKEYIIILSVSNQSIYSIFV